MPRVGPPQPLTRAQQVDELANLLDDRFPGHGYGGEYVTYADNHPHLSAKAALESWELNDLTKGLAKSINLGLGHANDLGGDAAGAIPDVFKGLNLDSWFVRVGEILAGLVLLAIGINSLTKGTPVKAAGAVAKVVR